jgi:phospholipid transport system substrate-binding protein
MASGRPSVPEKEAAVAHRLPFLFALTISALSVTPAWASTPREDLRAHVEQLLSVVEDDAITADERAGQARDAVRDSFDFSGAAPRALGPHWGRLSAAQRQETTRALTGLLTESVVAHLRQAPRRFANRMRERIAYGRESISGNRASVRMTLVRGHEDVPVVASMVRRGRSWRVDDLWFDGVSLVDNYRAQFDRLLRAGTYDAIMQRLHAKRETLTVVAAAPREARK